eukprot:618102-Prymnesium_polylepis.1
MTLKNSETEDDAPLRVEAAFRKTFGASSGVGSEAADGETAGGEAAGGETADGEAASGEAAGDPATRPVTRSAPNPVQRFSESQYSTFSAYELGRLGARHDR